MKNLLDIQNLLISQPNEIAGIDTVSTILSNNTSDKDDYTTIARKIDYREIEYNKLKKINSIINIIYYTAVLLLFLLLFSENNLLLKERFLFYILLLLIPYLYPWIYNLIKTLWNALFPNVSTTGPKNAFLNNINTNLPNYADMPYNV
jgi:hypothetical protein